MSLVVRKIELGKWNQRKILQGESASADAITGSLKTTQNALSVWHIHDSTQLEEAVLAIASALKTLDSLDFLLVETSFIESKGLKLFDSGPARTPYQDFMSNHRDVINLDYFSLGTVANIFIESIRRIQWVRFTFKELKNILYDGINSGKIKTADLDPSLLKKLYPQPKTEN